MLALSEGIGEPGASTALGMFGIWLYLYTTSIQ